MDELGMDRKFTSRSLNDGFSGGEKKRCEILQMSMLDPHIAFWMRLTVGWILMPSVWYQKELIGC